jgi:hypothetical protein
MIRFYLVDGIERITIRRNLGGIVISNSLASVNATGNYCSKTVVQIRSQTLPKGTDNKLPKGTDDKRSLISKSTPMFYPLPLDQKRDVLCVAPAYKHSIYSRLFLKHQTFE